MKWCLIFDIIYINLLDSNFPLQWSGLSDYDSIFLVIRIIMKLLTRLPWTLGQPQWTPQTPPSCHNRNMSTTYSVGLHAKSLHDHFGCSSAHWTSPLNGRRACGRVSYNREHANQASMMVMTLTFSSVRVALLFALGFGLLVLFAGPANQDLMPLRSHTTSTNVPQNKHFNDLKVLVPEQHFLRSEAVERRGSDPGLISWRDDDSLENADKVMVDAYIEMMCLDCARFVVHDLGPDRFANDLWAITSLRLIPWVRT
jgi:hypothetical protein